MNSISRVLLGRVSRGISRPASLPKVSSLHSTALVCGGGHGHGHDSHVNHASDGHDDHHDDHHHHTPNMPPFARMRPPTSKLPEEVELVWDDTVAPETTIDFDAPHVDTTEVLQMFAGAFLFFAGLYTLVSLSDPVGSNPVALRSNVIPLSTMQQIVGQEVTADEDHHDEEEEDH